MILYQKYDFTCVWTSDALMPAYWGSALRGGLGKWLRKTSCILRSRSCGDCAVRHACAYGFLFETERIKSESGRINVRPHPIVLELPYPCHFSTKEGERFGFSLILVGKADEYLPHLVYSFIKLGVEDGIGAKSRQGYGRFDLVSVSSGNEAIYERDSSQLKRHGSLRKLDIETPEGACSEIEVVFETPLRVKYRGHFARSMPFHLLVRTALRRISSMEEFYGQGEPELDYKGLIEEAEKIGTVFEELHWREVPRYSSRQKSKMTIGGLVGRAAYQGDLTEFVPLIRYCEVVHLGKQTFFGLGKIRMRIEV